MEDIMRFIIRIWKFVKDHDKAILFFLGVVAVIYNLYFLFIPLERDEAGYAYVAWIWFERLGIPYLSIFDQKTPLAYVLYGIGVLFNPNGFFGIRLVSLIYKFLIIIFSFKLIKKLSNSFLAWTLTLVIAWILSSIRLQGNEFNTEAIMLLPFIIFVYTILFFFNQKNFKRKIFFLFMIGLWASFAFLGKTTAVFAIGLLMLWFLFKRKNIFDFIPIGIGFMLPIVFFVWYFWVHHALSQMITDVIIYNRFYAQDGLKPSSIAVVSGHSGIFGYFIWLTMLPQLLIPLFVIAGISLLIGIKKRSTAWWIGLLFSLGMYLGAKNGGSREFPHYYIPFGIALTIACIPLGELLLQIKKQAVISALVILFIGTIFVPEMLTIIQGPRAIQEMQYGIQGDWFEDAITIGTWMQTHRKNEDTLLVWASEPEVYYYSRKLATTGYMHFYGLYYSVAAQKAFDREIHTHLPDVVVTYINDPPSFVPLMQYFSETKVYKKVGQIGSYYIYQNTSTHKL